VTEVQRAYCVGAHATNPTIYLRREKTGIAQN